MSGRVLSEEEIVQIEDEIGPRVGDTWRSRDRRDDGLTVKILAVEDGRVRIKRFNRTWVRRDRFRRDYILVERGDAS